MRTRVFVGLSECPDVCHAGDMKPDFAKLDALKEEWDGLQPLSAENDARLWKKLRLEWNYHSNHIEGNTLTYGETELLLLHDQTAGSHPLRDYEEMKAHDVGIAYVRKLATEDRVIGEADIRDLNKLILKEAFWKPAITQDGVPTRKRIVPGDYKSSPNNVRTATGKIFEFASPEETPAKMQDLVSWLRRMLESRILDPVELIAKLHHDFVLIHPFDDGNGRVARLLVNYTLMKSGYLPVIVKSEDKAAYLAALRQADVGDLPALVSYLAARCEWSLELGIRAAKGLSIEEPSDVEKEVAIFIRNQQKNDDPVVSRNSEVMAELYSQSWKPLFEEIESKLSKLNPLFTEVRVAPDIGFGTGDWRRNLAQFVALNGQQEKFGISFYFRGYRGRAASPFDLTVNFQLEVLLREYLLKFQGIPVIRRPYTQQILPDEIEAQSTQILKQVFEDVKRNSDQE